MPRRKDVPKRRINPDAKFGDLLATRFINQLMQRGKKTIAEKVFYGALDRVASITQQEPLRVFKQALENSKPRLEVKSRRVGGATYQVPIEVPQDRAVSLAMRWLISYARNRGENSMTDKLANEIVDAFGNKGNTIKKRDDTHRMAEANKAFAHYKW